MIFPLKKKNTTLILGLSFAVTIHLTALFSYEGIIEPIKNWSLVGIILTIIITISLYYHFKIKRKKTCDYGPFRENFREDSNERETIWQLFRNIFKSKIKPEQQNAYDYSTQHKRSSEPTFYELLGVQNDSTDEEINTAFRKQILKFHADKNNIDEADEFVKILYVARDTLLSSMKRREYDSQII